MSVARKDDRHNEDLANEIADSFNRALGAKKKDGEQADDQPKFRITGDNRTPEPKNRRTS